MTTSDRNGHKHPRKASSRQVLKAPSRGAKRRLGRALSSPQVAAYVMELASKRSRTFQEMARLTAERFGRSLLTADEIACFVCRQLAGKSCLNRLGRDPELAAWLRENAGAGRIDDIHAACVREFGPSRAPSRTVLAAFLHRIGRRGRHGDRRSIDGDPEVAAWLRAEAAQHTQMDLRLACRKRYGVARTPSRSTLSRFIHASGCHSLGRSRLAQDPEVAGWLRERARGSTMGGLRAACLAEFGPSRTPSRTAIHRFLSRLPGGKLTRRMNWTDKDREVADWLAEHRDGATLDELHAAAVARFGAERSPSRSALARFFPARPPRRPT